MDAELIFTSANVIFTIGTIVLFKKVLKNRNMLKDFDFIGSFMTTVAMALMIRGYFELDMTSSILFSIPTFSFWLFVSIYSCKYKLNKCNVDN